MHATKKIKRFFYLRACMHCIRVHPTLCQPVCLSVDQSNCFSASLSVFRTTAPDQMYVRSTSLLPLRPFLPAHHMGGRVSGLVSNEETVDDERVWSLELLSEPMCFPQKKIYVTHVESIMWFFCQKQTGNRYKHF